MALFVLHRWMRGSTSQSTTRLRPRRCGGGGWVVSGQIRCKRQLRQKFRSRCHSHRQHFLFKLV
uniref:Uncharacterized protein n=1 Tax=Oryza sativa subsp. japonica TaxID=39947 RepID=Q6ZCA2_ORYSJ|nr:hypothetical protein [Oryza sativa Japonica Group]